jgi:DnaJ like chaperone protein
MNRLKILIRRCPPWLRSLSGPVLGGIAGLFAGVTGVIIGLILGYFVKELTGQLLTDKKIRAFFENPGKVGFYEGERGLPAFCALGILVSGAAGREFEGNAEFSLRRFSGNGEAAVEKTCRLARNVFPAADPSLIEHFCRLAWSRRANLNPDLLAESLAAGRKDHGDLPLIARNLYSLVSGPEGIPGETAVQLARNICRTLDPLFRAEEGAEYSGASPDKDPWKLLGLSPDTPLAEIKSHYRRLAAQFHPDALQVLDEEHRETAARAFIAIKGAYRQVTGGDR